MTDEVGQLKGMLAAGSKYDRKQNLSHSVSNTQYHTNANSQSRAAPRYNSNPSGGRRNDNQSLRATRSTSSGHANSDNRSRSDQSVSSFDGSSSKGNGSYRRHDQHGGGAPDNRPRRNVIPQTRSTLNASAPTFSASSTTIDHNNINKQPFCFEVEEEDLLICEMTAESMRKMYSRVTYDEEILAKISELALNTQNFLQLQQQNLAEFYDAKRDHDIQVWLSSCSEEERNRYWGRMQYS